MDAGRADKCRRQAVTAGHNTRLFSLACTISTLSHYLVQLCRSRLIAWITHMRCRPR